MIDVSIPTNFNTNLLMMFRWIHFIAGITWIGLLYFFNLVSVPFFIELDPATKGKVFPALMSRALWWFRWASVVTVLMGFGYWQSIVGSDAHHAIWQTTASGMNDASLADVHSASTAGTMASFFLIWTVAWALMYACVIPGKGPLNQGPVLGVVYTVIVLAASWLFLYFNNHGWESNRLLAIGIGGGIGWMMMFNVWGVVCRAQKKIIQWTKDSAANGTPMPDKTAYLSRQTFLMARANLALSFPMLFLMGAASHYPMFGSK